jgi:hypothetical protein
MFKRDNTPDGNFKVHGSTVLPSYQYETYKKCNKQNKNGVWSVQATNHPDLELDLSWLPAAAESYHLSSDLNDYILVSLPIVTVAFPNRNLQAFAMEEMGYFCPIYGCLVYQTFNRKCCHIDHANEDPTKAKGVIVDSSLQYLPKYNLWKINAITLWDRSKDNKLVQDIVTKKRTGYSMGATVNYFLCSICGKVDNMDKDSCEHMKNKGGLYPVRDSETPRLAFQHCSGTTFFEISSVTEPADPTALSEDVFI